MEKEIGLSFRQLGGSRKIDFVFVFFDEGNSTSSIADISITL
jgi:hypothetical protein